MAYIHCKCGTVKNNIPDEHVGKKGRCPKCKDTVFIESDNLDLREKYLELGEKILTGKNISTTSLTSSNKSNLVNADYAQSQIQSSIAPDESVSMTENSISTTSSIREKYLELGEKILTGKNISTTSLTSSNKSNLVNADYAQSQIQSSIAPDESTSMDSPKKKTVALLLCFFFGIYGIHRFYVGKIGTGIVSIILFFAASSFAISNSAPAKIFGIVGLILLMIVYVVDLFKIASDKFTDNNGRYLKNW